MQRKYELKPLILETMKRAFQYLLLIVALTACSSNQQCTTLGCEAMEQTNALKRRNTKNQKQVYFQKKCLNKQKIMILN